MLWTEESLELLNKVNSFVINKYKVLEYDFNEESDNYIINNILLPSRDLPLQLCDVYTFYALKIYSVIDSHMAGCFYFDQIYAYFPSNGQNFETNMYNSDNEIFNIADEFGLKSEDKNIIRQIFGRIRFLYSKNIYDLNIAHKFNICQMDYENPMYYENENFKTYFKNYLKAGRSSISPEASVLNKNSKHLRYLDLLRKVLVKSYYLRKNIFIPLSSKELLKLIEDPLIWTILEPYNHIL